MGNFPGVEREILNRVQLDVRAAIQRETSSIAEKGEQLPRRVYIRAISGIGEGTEAADHSEECRTRTVRHMTADDDLNQRLQIAQHTIVETAPSEARAGERYPVLDHVRKKVRFAERVEEQNT